MGKMKKEDLEKMKRENPAENNREVPDEEGRMKNEAQHGTGTSAAERQQEPVPCAPTPEELHEVFAEITDGTVEAEELKRRLYWAWCQVPGEIAQRNPVWKFSVRDEPVKIVTFIFRDGRKIRVFD